MAGDDAGITAGDEAGGDGASIAIIEINDSIGAPLMNACVEGDDANASRLSFDAKLSSATRL